MLVKRFAGMGASTDKRPPDKGGPQMRKGSAIKSNEDERGFVPKKSSVKASSLPYDIFVLLFDPPFHLDRSDLLSCLLVNKFWARNTLRLIYGHPGKAFWPSFEAMHLFLHAATRGIWRDLVEVDGTVRGLDLVPRLQSNIAGNCFHLVDELRGQFIELMENRTLNGLRHLGLDLSLFPHPPDSVASRWPNLNSLHLVGPAAGTFWPFQVSDKAWPTKLIALELNGLVSEKSSQDGMVLFWDRFAIFIANHLPMLRKLSVRNDARFSDCHLSKILQLRSLPEVRSLVELSVVGCPLVTIESLDLILGYAKTRNSLRLLELQLPGLAPTLEETGDEQPPSADDGNTCVRDLWLISWQDVTAASKIIRSCRGLRSLRLDSCCIKYEIPTPPLYEHLAHPVAAATPLLVHLELENLVSLAVTVGDQDSEDQETHQTGISLPALLRHFPNLRTLRMNLVPFAPLHPLYVYHLGQQTPTMDVPLHDNLERLDISSSASRIRADVASTTESLAQLMRSSLNPLAHLHGIHLREAHLLFLVRALPNVSRLSLHRIHGDAITDAVIFAISRRMKRLQTLRLGRCFIGDRSMAHLGHGIAHPSSLNVSDNPFGDVGLRQFLQIRGSMLKELFLDSCTRLGDSTLVSVIAQTSVSCRLRTTTK